jgi:hypothetical protein
MHGCLSAVAQFSVALTIIHLFIYLSFHLRLPRWLLARAPPVTLYICLFIYLFNWFHIRHCTVRLKPSMHTLGYDLLIYLPSGIIPGERRARML